MTQLTIGYLCAGILMTLVVLAVVAAFWDALVHNDWANLVPALVLIGLVVGAVWGLGAA